MEDTETCTGAREVTVRGYQNPDSTLPALRTRIVGHRIEVRAMLGSAISDFCHCRVFGDLRAGVLGEMRIR